MYTRFNILLLLLSMSLVSCSQDQDVKIIKLAHGLDPSHPVHQAMEYMAERLTEKSAGQMQLDIYPSGQLGAERELIELLQIGSLAMTKVSASPMESFVLEMKLFSIPYVFSSEAHLWQILQGPIGQDILLAGQDFRLRGLGYFDAGSRSFYTKETPIHSPTDLQGLKIRVMKSLTAVKMVQALGGSATPISWGELYTALQQGVVDGAENNPPSFFLSKHYEVCKYYSLDEHTSVPDILLISTVVWESLSSQQQTWLQEAVNESVTYQRRLWKKSTDHALAELVKAGVQIIQPEKVNFQQSVKDMHESYRGTAIYDLIQEIAALDTSGRDEG
ncbi:MAG: TRAP transporter substrate-binding protein [Candidatus Marinimicrobia bacterium]|nr:TRAP transporter substrate-binding protein [Candidatus Neomarinimicrobiota bacterium]